MSTFREKLKNLTPEQCVNIAKIGEPSINWKHVISKNKWDGHDLIPEGKNENEPNFVFQIDYRKAPYKSIFRFYDELGNESNSENVCEIIDYINSL